MRMRKDDDTAIACFGTIRQQVSQPFRLLTYLDVSPRVPLYIVYYTAYPNPKTGMVETWPDLYGYDKVISREIKSFLL